MINFTLLNIKVNIHFSFLIFVLIFIGIEDILSFKMILQAIVLFLSLLIHEYGHGLTALYFGKNPEINLVAFGGNTTYNSYKITQKQDFFITLNGPLFQSLLILLAFYLLKSNIFYNYYLRYFLHITMDFNIFWCLVNLIPLYPLDGGHLMRSLLTMKFKEKGLKISLIISSSCSVLGSTYFFTNNYFFFAILFFFYGIQNYQEFTRNRFHIKQSDFSKFNDGIKASDNNELKKAKSIFKKLLKKNTNTNIKFSALESLADVLYKEKENKKAYNMLLNSDHNYLKKGKCLLCKLAFYEKNYELIKKYSVDIYEIEPSYEIAILNSKAYACLNNPELSGGWMKTASLFEDSKKDELIDIIKDTIYDKVRNQSSFKTNVKDLYEKKLF